MGAETVVVGGRRRLERKGRMLNGSHLHPSLSLMHDITCSCLSYRLIRYVARVEL